MLISPEPRSCLDSLDTAPSLAKFLNVSVACIRKYTRTTDMPVVRIGAAVRYDRMSVLTWLQAGGPKRNCNGGVSK